MATVKIAKYATHGVVAAGVYQMMNPGASVIKLSLLNNKALPIWVVAAAMGISASLLADVAHDYLLPYVSADQRMKHVESALLSPVAGGVSFIGASYLANPDLVNVDEQLKSLFITGAVSELAAQWTFENLIIPYIDPSFQDDSAF